MEKNVKRTIKTYNEIAEIYDQLQYSTDVSEEIIESFLRAFQGQCLLDVGCGPGNDTRVFVDNGLDVTGIDLSERLLRLAMKNVPRSSFLLMDMRRPAIKDESFGGLWVCSSFIHVPRSDAKPTLREFARILKPNGLMFINVIEGKREGIVAILGPHSPSGHGNDFVGVDGAGYVGLRSPHNDPVRLPFYDSQIDVRIVLFVGSKASVALGIGHRPGTHEVVLLYIAEEVPEMFVIMGAVFLVDVI